mgnify:CR=1 FL=1
MLPSEYWIDDVKQGDCFDVVTDGSSYGPCSFGDAWFYLAGVDAGCISPAGSVIPVCVRPCVAYSIR